MNGVVQVGAHAGEEVNGWLDEGRKPIYCFEPQPMLRIHRFSTDVTWSPIALASVSRRVLPLSIPQHLTEAEGMDTQSASLLELIPDRAIENGWTPTPVEKIMVPVQRFDYWAPRNCFQRSCTLLKIDVQGYELQVLEGFGDYLKDFSEIVVECSSPPLYRGGSDATEVEEFLGRHGFRRMTPILQHGDVKYIR